MKNKLIILFFIISSSVTAQNIVVRNGLTNEIIDGVLVYFEGDLQTKTNKKGSVDLSLFKNTDTLFFSCIGYEEVYVVKEKLQGELYLNPIEYSFPLINIIAEKESFVNQEQNFNTLKLKKISMLSVVNSSDLVEKMPNVSIQENQSGGASLNVRGMEANRLLLVVDDVVLNNTIYRGGHVQNSNFINPLTLKKIEILNGPSCVSYGDGSMGSAVVFNTINPLLTNEVRHFLHQQYESSSKGKVVQYHIRHGSNKLAFFTSINVKSFGNLRMGKNRYHGYENWGRDIYVTNENEQLETNYSQLHFLNKMAMRVNNNSTININSHYFMSSIINRYDKINDIKDGEKKYTHWYYGPQSHFLNQISFHLKKQKLLFDKFSFSTSFQDLNESRNKQKLNEEYMSIREEAVSVHDLKFEMNKYYSKSKINYGAEYRRQFVKSKARLENSYGENYYNSTRYPDGGSSVADYSIYVQAKSHITPFMSIYLGSRLNNNCLDAKFNDTITFKLPFSNISNKNSSLTYSLGIDYELNENVGFNVSFYSGFRNPNLDDVGKVFSKNDLYVVVPNDNLNPEKTINFESKIFLKKGSVFSLSAIYFHSTISDVIMKAFSNLNGSDSIVYDGEVMRVQMNQNIESAKIHGGGVNLDFNISKNLIFSCMSDYKLGRDHKNQPISHISPFSIKSDLIYKFKASSVKLYHHYNGRKKPDEYDLYGVDNLSEATENGNPKWQTINFRYTKELEKGYILSVAVENIFDAHYKKFGSSVSSSGRNLIISLQSYF